MGAELQYETHVLPNGEHVFYVDEAHSYFVNGVELPSITTLISKAYGDVYSSVNPGVLAAAAEYGTAVHNELQLHIDRRLASDEYIPGDFAYQETKNYFDLVEPIWKISPIMTERVVVLYNQDGVPSAAGRFDLLCNVGSVMNLVDFKTTSVIHKKQVTAQLNLYLTAATQSGYLLPGNDVQLGVVHLHGTTSKYVPIQRLSDNFYLQFLNQTEV